MADDERDECWLHWRVSFGESGSSVEKEGVRGDNVHASAMRGNLFVCFFLKQKPELGLNFD
jgi:hypothetical protein